MSCHVCAAPALPLEGVCVFCRSPLLGAPETHSLLDYLAARLPAAAARRAGLFRRGPVVELRYEGFRARVRRDGLQLTPQTSPTEWSDRLLRDLSRRAAGDPDVRRAMTRAGWALR